MTEMFTLAGRNEPDLIEDVALLNARIEPIISSHLDSWYFLDDSIEPLPV